jgi:hypothetical protein
LERYTCNSLLLKQGLISRVRTPIISPHRILRPVAVAAIVGGVGAEVKEDVVALVGILVDMVNQDRPLEPNLSVNSARRPATRSPVAGNSLIETLLVKIRW